ncbi:hypothetical protein BLM37_03880 [Candidatus Gracilibacteria bacterium GN02-873]|nr:hypothetical protein BLM37_03880 [Candidatus Gracilibacteria bacterium GN02-873]
MYFDKILTRVLYFFSRKKQIIFSSFLRKNFCEKFHNFIFNKRRKAENFYTFVKNFFIFFSQNRPFFSYNFVYYYY